MKLLKPVLYTFTAALTLGSLSIGFSPAASAATTANAAAAINLTLEGVTDSLGSTVTDGWEVFAEGFEDTFVDEPTDGSAAVASAIVPAGVLSIGDTITQSASASATSINGIATADIFTALDIFVSNSSQQALLFMFSYQVITGAFTSGEFSTASGTVDFLDDLGFVDILQNNDSIDGIVDPGIFTPGTFEFTLADTEVNYIGGFVDATAQAVAPAVVPIPAAVWLFGSGLIGLVGIARRKKA